MEELLILLILGTKGDCDSVTVKLWMGRGRPEVYFKGCHK